MKNLNELSLKELRELYPDIKSTSKANFLAQIEEPINEVVEEPVKLTYDNLLEYVAGKINTREKILIKCEDSLTADDVFLNFQYKFFPLLNKKGISVLASSSRRDMHINGTLYVRLACKNNYEHVKGMLPYTTFEELT